MRVQRIVLLLLTTVWMLWLCGCPGAVPGSRLYQPLPKWEAKFFAEARRDVFPRDVRQNPQRFRDDLVVWTGIIKKIEYVQFDSASFMHAVHS